MYFLTTSSFLRLPKISQGFFCFLFFVFVFINALLTDEPTIPLNLAHTFLTQRFVAEVIPHRTLSCPEMGETSTMVLVVEGDLEAFSPCAFG